MKEEQVPFQSLWYDSTGVTTSPPQSRCSTNWATMPGGHVRVNSYDLNQAAPMDLFKIKDHHEKEFFVVVFLLCWGFNDTSTLEGHFVSSPREREKSDRRDSRRDEREGQGRKRNRNESEETEEIKTFPLYPYLLQGEQALPNCKPKSVGCPYDVSYMTPSLHLTTPKRSFTQRVYGCRQQL